MVRTQKPMHYKLLSILHWKQVVTAGETPPTPFNICSTVSVLKVGFFDTKLVPNQKIGTK
jgi:hypothetical protein